MRKKLTTTSGCKLYISSSHAVKIIALRSLCALLDHAVAVRQLTTQDVAENFSVAMRVCGEASSAGHAVFVEHAQAAEALEFRLVVVRKTKRVVRVEPAVVGVAACAGAPRNNRGMSEFGHVLDGGCRAHG